jgi:membrane-bound acyltransferase YfiQ involved in biofilm formation
MIVVLTTPIIYWLLKHTRHYFVLFLGLLWFTLGLFGDFLHLSQLVVAYFYFTFGAYMSINKKDMLVEFGKYRRLSVILYVLLSLLFVAMLHICPIVNRVIHQLNIFVGLIFAYNMASWLLEKDICKPNKFLASASFFIYVTHTLICTYILKLHFFIFTPTTDAIKFFVYTSTVLITTSSLLLSFWLLREYAPNVLKVIAGRK